MKGFLAGFAGAVRGKWVPSWLLFTAVLLIPFIGPIVVAGWYVERVRRVAAGDGTVPPLALGRYVAQGLLGLVGTALWGLVPFVGGLLGQASLASFASAGAFSGFLDFKGILGRIRSDLVGYLMVLVKGFLASLPLAIVSMAAVVPVQLAVMDGRSPSVLSLAVAAVGGVACLLGCYFPVMASSHYLGAWVAGVDPAVATAPTLTGLTVAAGLADDGDEHELALPPEILAPVPPAAPPRNVVAVFSEASAVMNPALPGEAVLYEAGQYSIPALGKTVGAATVMQMDAKGLLHWPRPEIRDAVAKSAD